MRQTVEVQISEPGFALCQASVRIDEREILRPLNLRLAPGRCYGLIGPNGSGKSTLIKLMARQISLSSGRIHFHGRPLDEWNPRVFARHVGYLPQFTPSTDGLLVEELVALGRYPWHGALRRFSAADRSKIDEAIKIAHIESLRTRSVDSLSGGERQRAWLAMLLAQNATHLLLDEPTSALDIAHQIEVLSVIRNLSRRRGITTLVVLHDVNMAARYCDEIIALRHGTVIARGAPDTILRSETLGSIYSVRMGVVRPEGSGHAIGYVL